MSEIFLDRQQQQSAEPIKAPAWKNLDFTKDGRSFPGPMIHPSEEIARQVSDEFSRKMDVEHRLSLFRGLGGIEIVDDNDQHEYFWEEYSHTIQIPWCKP